MDDTLDQAVGNLISDDTKSGEPVAKAVDDSLDAAILDLVPTIPDF